MKIFYFSLVCFASILILSCSDEPTTPLWGLIRGTVRSSLNYTQLKDVFIYTVPPSKNAFSDTAGYFILDPIFPRAYIVVASKKNYISDSIYVFVKPGQEANTFLIIEPVTEMSKEN